MARRFRDRGGLWVLVQSFLLVGILAMAPLVSGGDLGWLARTIAISLIVLGSAFGIAGAMTLGRSRTIYPEPPENARLVCHGIYALVRHPIYTSLIFLSFGWSLAWSSVAGLVISAVMTLFLMAKLADEESRLKKRFPNYEAYMKTTKRLIPWIY